MEVNLCKIKNNSMVKYFTGVMKIRDGQRKLFSIKSKRSKISVEGEGSSVKGLVTERSFLGAIWLFKVEILLNSVEICCKDSKCVN